MVITGRRAGRRGVLRGLALASVGVAGLTRPASARAMLPGKQQPPLSADQALQQLLDGNRRFVAGTLSSVNDLLTRRSEVAAGQHPIAAILGCADSRVSPELIFDQGVGDVFVVRAAGQVIDEAAVASLEFAADGLGVPLIVVVGHRSCGAVAAALQALRGDQVPPYLYGLVREIAPAARQALGQSGDELDLAVRANVELQVAELQATEPVLAKGVREGRLRIVGAYYDLRTGTVTLIA